MTRTLGATDKRKRRRYFDGRTYALTCPRCVSAFIHFRRGEWQCYKCKLTFPAEAVQRVGKLPDAFRAAK